MSPVRKIERLVGSLRCVSRARAIADETGQLESIHVLAPDDVLPEEVVRQVESALLTYFDVCPEPDRISVAITSDPAFSSGPASRSSRQAEPWPRLEGTRRAPSRFVKYVIEGTEGTGCEIRVTVASSGHRYEGCSRAEDVSALDPIVFAEAAARAAMKAADSTRSKAPDGIEEFQVIRTEETEASGRPFLAVSLKASGEGDQSVITGFHPISTGMHSAAILAALDAVRRAIE